MRKETDRGVSMLCPGSQRKFMAEVVSCYLKETRKKIDLFILPAAKMLAEPREALEELSHSLPSGYERSRLVSPKVSGQIIVYTAVEPVIYSWQKERGWIPSIKSPLILLANDFQTISTNWDIFGERTFANFWKIWKDYDKSDLEFGPSQLALEWNPDGDPEPLSCALTLVFQNGNDTRKIDFWVSGPPAALRQIWSAGSDFNQYLKKDYPFRLPQDISL